ncbi:hypothetical protein OsI_20483 [Oryza sativa Indica Group]|uniref:Protein translation factor SUI1 homolog n=6 Tax=Oryza TaxID=4527 RepID=B9FKY7_ORYSJ|nr:hypothetical protein OsI_20483 [Oryza sativa Indica Group]EEE64240.1 hypothetical protein OsJ_19073 [Oryza sativa Japonica Group]
MARSSAAAASSDPGSGGEDDEEGRLSRCWCPPLPLSLPLSRRGSGPPAASAVAGKAREVASMGASSRLRSSPAGGRRLPRPTSKSLICPVPTNQQTSFMSDLDVQLPSAFDPFAEANAEDSGAGPGAKDYVHVRIQQRNGRKSLTTVQGLKKEYSYNKILKDLKKEFCCNGTVVQDPELGQVIQLQGDQRKNVATFLVQAGIAKKDNIKIHGF